MSIRLIPSLNFRFTDSNGNPLALGSVKICLANTSTLAPIYSSISGTPASNPINLDSSGCYAGINSLYMSDGNLVDVYIYDGLNGHGNLLKTIEDLDLSEGGSGGGISGSGTAGHIPLWTDTEAIGDSNLTQAESGVVTASAGFDAGALLYLGSVELNGVKISTDFTSTSDLHLVTAGYVGAKYLKKDELTDTQLFGSSHASGRTQFGSTSVGGFGKVENAEGQGIQLNSYLQGSSDAGYQEVLFAGAGYGARLSRTDLLGANKTNFDLPPIANGSGTIALREWVSASYALASSLASYLPLAGGGMTGTIDSNITNGSIPLLIARIKNQAWNNLQLSQSGEFSWGYGGLSATQSLTPASQTLMSFSHGLQIFGSKEVATTDMFSSYLNLAGGVLTGAVTPNATGLDFGSLTNRWDIFAQDIDASGALTVAGALTANGAVTLGNASADDITVLGSLVGNLVLKTNNSTEIGSTLFRLANLWSTLLNVSGTATMAGAVTVVNSENYGMTLERSGANSGPIFQLRSNFSGTWVDGGRVGRVEFYSSDGSGPGAGPRGYVETQMSNTTGTASRIVMGVANGSAVVDVVKFGYTTAEILTALSVTGALTDKNSLKVTGASFAEIHVHDASTAQSIPNGTTYTKLTAFTENGLSENCTPDATNDKITVTKTGIYKVLCEISASAGTVNLLWNASIFIGGVEQDQVHWQTKIAVSGDVQSMSMSGFVDITSANTDVDVRIRHSGASAANFTVVYANLNVQRVSDT